MRILVVDDDEECRRVLYLYMAPLGDCDAVEDGAIAVAFVKKAFEEDKPYDLICLDIIMPNKNGQQALAEIRAIEKQHGRTRLNRSKILMITALGDSTNVLKALGSQCDSYVVKPINKAALHKQISTLGFLIEPKTKA